jgi:ribosomal protein L29
MARAKKSDAKEAEVVKKAVKKAEAKVVKSAKDLRDLDLATLNAMLNSELAELNDAQKMLHANELPNTQVISIHRRNIARISTLITEKKFNQAEISAEEKGDDK